MGTLHPKSAAIGLILGVFAGIPLGMTFQQSGNEESPTGLSELANAYRENEESRTREKEQSIRALSDASPIDATLEALLTLHKENPAKWELLYKGKTWEFEGRVSQISEGMMSGPFVSLDRPGDPGGSSAMFDQRPTVSLHFAESQLLLVSQLTRNQIVRARGVVSSADTGPLNRPRISLSPVILLE